MTRSSGFVAAAAGLSLLSGCAAVDGFFDSLRGERTAPPAPLAERLPEEPIPANRFVLREPGQSVIGTPQVVLARNGDTLPDIARTYGLGHDELLAANPGVDPWLPGENTPVLLPTQFVIPDVRHEGIVLNVATKRLFYFPTMPEGTAQVVLTYPIGIGRVGWETPVGNTVVTSKAVDPDWYVPASVRREHAALGDPLPAVVPPGPDNPLGNRVLTLAMPGYLIHGTNQPYGVGMRVSHGCVRLYPENIEALFELVEVGDKVTIVNEPYLFGMLDDEVYFEAHPPLEDDAVVAAERLQSLLENQRDAAGVPLVQADRNHVRSLASAANGMPARLSAHDADEMLARARLVRNTVVPDADAPTLGEIRESIDEAVREARLESESEAL